MTVAGVDIGSRTAKLVVMKDGQPFQWSLVPTGIDPIGAARNLIDGRRFDYIVATGYGRHLARADLAAAAVTEVKACAVGAHFLFPECRTVIDVGGQDTKVVVLDVRGGLTDFAMNDRCAAGTGRFLEVMAQTLGFTIEEFGSVCCDADASVQINSMCVVLAESEVISLIARGKDARQIGRAVHQTMVDRIASLTASVGLAGDSAVLAGGVARNPCIVHLLERKLRVRLLVHEYAQFIPALGAALVAQSRRIGN